MAPDEIAGLKDESLLTTHSTISVSEGVHRGEQNCILVRSIIAKNKEALLPYAWVEDLLRAFFCAMISFPMTSLTECMIFASGHSNNLDMTFDNSLEHSRVLTGLLPWVGMSVHFIALQ